MLRRYDCNRLGNRRNARNMDRTLINKTLVPIALFLWLMHAAPAAAQITAVSCNQADVKTALTSVTATTTTVNIPAGSCSWTSQITFVVPSGNTNLSILGAGNLSTLGGGDATSFVDNDTTDSNWLLSITTAAASSHFRIAGITFQAGSGTQKQNGMIIMGGSSQNVRFDHIHLQQTTGSGESIFLRIVGWQYGVADHVLGDGNVYIQPMLDTYGTGSSNFGDQSWAAATNFGSGAAWFIEDSTFNAPAPTGGQYNDYMTDCYQGGRLVVRHNILNNYGVDEHPTGGAGRWRGCRSVEIYDNTMNGNTSTPTFSGFFDSSATALVWGNALGNGFESLIWLVSARNGYDYPQTATPNGWGYCGTQFNGTGSNWDQNLNPTNGYRCLDQAGAGQSDLLNATDFPGALNTVTGTIAWPHQALEPIYEWLNEWQPTSYAPSRAKVSLEDTTHDSNTFIQNRDWYQYTLAWNGTSFTGTAFNGTVGTGSGLAAAIPSTCTPAVAYWETDANILKVCTAANTWTTYYTPYVYPHPLNTSTNTVATPTITPASGGYASPQTITIFLTLAR